MLGSSASPNARNLDIYLSWVYDSVMEHNVTQVEPSLQTFMPLPSMSDSLIILDHMRLGKQRVECWTILRSMRGEIRGWNNHPAVRMWRGYDAALVKYALTSCAVWQLRGYNDNMADRFKAYSAEHSINWREAELPPWIGHEPFHQSHRSNLLSKFPNYYREYWPSEPDNLPYLWPVSKTGELTL